MEGGQLATVDSAERQTYIAELVKITNTSKLRRASRFESRVGQVLCGDLREKKVFSPSISVSHVENFNIDYLMFLVYHFKIESFISVFSICITIVT